MNYTQAIKKIIQNPSLVAYPERILNDKMRFCYIWISESGILNSTAASPDYEDFLSTAKWQVSELWELRSKRKG